MKRILLVALLLTNSIMYCQELKRTENAFIEFTSEAPLELISASSSDCEGILDLTKMEFAFRVRIKSFEGFNSPLQGEHFNENYMESDLYPNATFSGRFLSEVDLTTQGTYSIEVKGILNVHNTKDERVLTVNLEVGEDGSLSFESDFTVELEAHKIDVPRIVYQKIAEVINVTVKGTLE